MLPILIAVVGMIAISWALWRPRLLGTGPAPAEPSTERVSVVIPARDEARNVPALLGCLSRSEVRPHEVIVVDDGSTDGTAEIAAHHGALVVPAGVLPDGWAGKPHACAIGASHATGDVLVFLDGDTRLSPRALGCVLAARAARGGLVSVQPDHRPATWIEQLSAVFNVCAVAGSGSFTAGADGAAPIAFGPCMAISRADYAAVGGHGAVGGSVIEDVAFARVVAASGRNVSALLGGDDLTFRMYPEGWQAMVQGWTKNIARGAASAPALPVMATVVWVAAMVATTIATVTGVARWAGGGRVPWIAIVAVASIAVHTVWVLARVGRFRLLTALLFPLPILFFIAVFLHSTLLAVLRRPVRWRGRMVTSHRGAP